MSTPEPTNDQWTQFTFERQSIEDDDEDYTVFKRRMGLRQYFKDLMTQQKRIHEIKANHAKIAKPAKKKGKKKK